MKAIRRQSEPICKASMISQSLSYCFDTWHWSSFGKLSNYCTCLGNRNLVYNRSWRYRMVNYNLGNS